jgi:hypothetical protein
MTVSAQSIFERVVRTLNDDTSVRWNIPELCRYFNDGQRDICVRRPDAMNTRTTHTLVAGYKQSLPANGTKLIDINANGLKNAVTLVPAALLDSQMRGWRNIPGTNDVLHYTYDARDPKTFEVYPPALATATVDMEYAALPTDIAIPALGTVFTDVTGNLSVGALFSNALQNYILYRCYIKDTEFAANPARAQTFKDYYADDLGVEIRATIAVGPSDKKQASPVPA